MQWLCKQCFQETQYWVSFPMTSASLLPLSVGLLGAGMAKGGCGGMRWWLGTKPAFSWMTWVFEVVYNPHIWQVRSLCTSFSAPMAWKGSHMGDYFPTRTHGCSGLCWGLLGKVRLSLAWWCSRGCVSPEIRLWRSHLLMSSLVHSYFSLCLWTCVSNPALTTEEK